MESIKTCTVIYNPVASHFDNAMLAQVLEKLQERNIEATVIKSNKAGHVVPLVKKYNPLCDLILTIGGDGTMGESFQGFFRQEQHALYTHLPAGTQNDSVANFGLVRNDLPASMDLILDGEVRAVDILTMNGDPFSYVSAFGYVANVPFDTPSALKRRMGRNSYIVYGLKEVAKGAPKIPLTYTKNGEVIEDSIMIALVSNSKCFAGVGIHPNADLCDGVFEVIFIRYATPQLIAQLLSDYLKNGIDFSHYGDAVQVFTTDELILTFNNRKRNIDLCNDGDKYKLDRDENLRLCYKIEGKLNMLLPKPLDS